MMDIDNKVVDAVGDLDDIEIKVNPSFYIHNGIMKAQAALTKDNVKEGFLQFWILVENIETICKAAKLLDDSYKDKINEFKATKEYQDLDDNKQMVKLANIKLRYLLMQVFENKEITTPLTDYKKVEKNLGV